MCRGDLRPRATATRVARRLSPPYDAGLATPHRRSAPSDRPIRRARGTELYRRNGLTGTTTTALHPNLGIEQTIPGNAVVVRAGVDETSYGGGITLRRRPLQLDIAYVYDLGRARVGNLFGTTSNSVLATLTFDMSWRATPVAAPPQAQTTARPN